MPGKNRRTQKGQIVGFALTVGDVFFPIGSCARARFEKQGKGF